MHIYKSDTKFLPSWNFISMGKLIPFKFCMNSLKIYRCDENKPHITKLGPPLQFQMGSDGFTLPMQQPIRESTKMAKNSYL